jgi:putative drug exporter of the RND superfamily
MATFAISPLRVMGQVGTTIGLGLLFDTLIVRSFMMPSVAALMGRWFWWPQRVRNRPASEMLQPYGSRSSVRTYMLPKVDPPARGSNGERPTRRAPIAPGSARHTTDPARRALSRDHAAGDVLRLAHFGTPGWGCR